MLLRAVVYTLVGGGIPRVSFIVVLFNERERDFIRTFGLIIYHHPSCCGVFMRPFALTMYHPFDISPWFRPIDQPAPTSSNQLQPAPTSSAFRQFSKDSFQYELYLLGPALVLGLICTEAPADVMLTCLMLIC